MKIIIPIATFIIYPFFFLFFGSSSWIRSRPQPNEAPTTAIPAIKRYALSSIPSKIDEIITAVVMYLAISSSQLANLSFLLLFLFMLQS